MSTISSTVMRRVRTIHMLRPLLGHILLLSGVFVLTLLGIAHDVWVARILENMPSLLHIRTFIAFAFNVFVNTETIVQFYVILATLVAIALMRDAIRLFFALIPRRGLFVA